MKRVTADSNSSSPYSCARPKDKLHVSEEDVRFAGGTPGFAKHVTPAEALDAVPRDETDNRILECAVAAGSGAVVTGDQHLLSLGNFGGNQNSAGRRVPGVASVGGTRVRTLNP